jgi:hypothetical protein
MHGIRLHVGLAIVKSGKLSLPFTQTTFSFVPQSRLLIRFTRVSVPFPPEFIQSSNKVFPPAAEWQPGLPVRVPLSPQTQALVTKIMPEIIALMKACRFPCFAVACVVVLRPRRALVSTWVASFIKGPGVMY